MKTDNKKNYGAFGDGKSRFTYPQTAPPEASENFIAAQALRKEYARKLLMFELEMNKANKKDRDVGCKIKKEIRKYSMSSTNRRNFIMHCCLATLNKKCISVPETKHLLGMSRQGMTDMVNECFEAEWILLDKDEAGFRRVKATPITLECWMDYADYVHSKVDKFDFVHINASRRAMELLTTVDNI